MDVEEIATVPELRKELQKRGLSEEACEFAKAALRSLRGDELQMRTEGDKHVCVKSS